MKLLPSGITFTQLDEISSQTDITKNYVGYSQANLKHFDENYNDSKSILMCCTHSSLPESSKKSLMVPDNICICFTTPILHLGYSDDKIFYPNPSDEYEDLFEDIFRYKQNMDDEILVYNNTTTPLYGSTNYFKHASWYYPGQLYQM